MSSTSEQPGSSSGVASAAPTAHTAAARAADVATPSPIELEVRRLRELLRAQRLAECLEGAKALLPQVPENRDVLFLVATSQRLLTQTQEALVTLEQLERHHPRFSRLYQERGQCYVVLKDAPRAIDAFLIAVNINPALPTSWRMLEGLYRLIGD